MRALDLLIFEHENEISHIGLLVDRTILKTYGGMLVEPGEWYLLESCGLTSLDNMLVKYPNAKIGHLPMARRHYITHIGFTHVFEKYYRRDEGWWRRLMKWAYPHIYNTSYELCANVLSDLNVYTFENPSTATLHDFLSCGVYRSCIWLR